MPQGRGSVTIKIGSIAPEGSPWDITLKKLGTEWKRISNGTVTLKIFPNGSQGDEADMIRKIRFNQLDAAAVTTMGLNRISTSFLILSLPMLFKDDAELSYVMDRMKPEFETIFEKEGFTIVAWTMAGWVNFFSKKPVLFPDDLKKQRLAVTKGDSELEQAWKSLGFNVRPVESTETLTALQNKMVDAFYTAPLVSLSYQWFALAKNMYDYPVAPMIGGFILSTRTWEKIPEDLRPRLKDAAERIVRPLYDDTKRLEKDAIQMMIANGLNIVKSTPEAGRAWEEALKQGYSSVIGKSISQDIYDKVASYLTEYRKMKGN
jgi:TRAP-type C4-dicarboxylate transport system substrate-binding protein